MGQAASAREHLAKIAADPVLFVTQQGDPQALAGPVTLPDGSQVARLPGITRWIWDGEFCGSINPRWQTGTRHCRLTCWVTSGFRWCRGNGGSAMRRRRWHCCCPRRAQGLDQVDLTTAPDNIASQKAILAYGGRLTERFRKEAAYGGDEGLRYRIML